MESERLLEAAVFSANPEAGKKENTMPRQYLDCRELPSDINCTVAISADRENELLEAAVQHAVAVHKHQDSAGLRDQLRKAFKEGTPPVYYARPGEGTPAYLKQEPEDDE
jgi:predicted small metal-binding protein